MQANQNKICFCSVCKQGGSKPRFLTAAKPQSSERSEQIFCPVLHVKYIALVVALVVVPIATTSSSSSSGYYYYYYYYPD